MKHTLFFAFLISFSQIQFIQAQHYTVSGNGVPWDLIISTPLRRTVCTEQIRLRFQPKPSPGRLFITTL
jgi:hypothetical protein